MKNKDIEYNALKLHKKLQGKIATENKIKVINKSQLSLLYSPGVAYPCLEIKKDYQKIYDYTIKANTIAIITNGSAVLGLGNIGADASLPVMEGKAMLMKYKSNINAFPICINENDPDKFIDIVTKISTSFGAINLEDIKAPECVYIEKKLKEKLNIPIFHDDQHGTAIICLASLIKALKMANKKISDIKIIISGSGAAGSAIFNLLKDYGAKNIYILNNFGLISLNSKTNNWLEKDIAKFAKSTDILNDKLINVIKDADVFIGVSVANILTKEMVNLMKPKAIVFALANPNPEISFDEIKKTNAFIYGSGRSDYPNQINNLSVFPSLLKECLEKKITNINSDYKIKFALKLSKNIILKKLQNC